MNLIRRDATQSREHPLKILFTYPKQLDYPFPEKSIQKRGNCSYLVKQEIDYTEVLNNVIDYLLCYSKF